ncbi:hypothetical protein, partial [Lautropia mirabilis]|uniref:hypothetical protein n=1 Tax=Lautropia mirabilis TaxID=47671 RepID=UPI001B7FD94C
MELIKQRKETGQAWNQAGLAGLAASPPAALTPRGGRAKEKGLETIQALGFWWSRRESNPRPKVFC